MFGSDILKGISNWPNYKKFTESFEIVVGVRDDDTAEISKIVTELNIPKITILKSQYPSASSSKIRHDIARGINVKECTQQVQSYAIKYNIYN